MSKLKVGSLFTGIGGFDLGFEQAGMEIEQQCDNDFYCQQLLSLRFKKGLYKDVRYIRSETVKPVDVLCGGFPCQEAQRKPLNYQTFISREKNEKS